MLISKMHTLTYQQSLALCCNINFVKPFLKLIYLFLLFNCTTFEKKLQYIITINNTLICDN